ncbi:MAG TPA: hypothetical protein VH120_15065, partial [Gemmataceae bacterium]|nr:hypothetical protein [Gemmataceae bacterium]
AKSTVPDLIEALQRSTDPATTVELCAALAHMGQFAERALGPLATLESNANESVKTAARSAIELIKKDMEAAKQKPPPVQPPAKKP